LGGEETGLRILLTGPQHAPGMVSRSRLKSLLTGLALYAMAAAMVGYFGVNAYTGKYGLNARQELDQEIIVLTSELARLKRERAEGEQRVLLLRSDRVDPDMLDERARYQLDYANPHDLVRIATPN
jgi:cell division protein FtsB